MDLALKPEHRAFADEIRSFTRATLSPATKAKASSGKHFSRDDHVIWQQALGKKGKSGVLKSVASRKEFLEDASHRIRFVYTPKHCSWLNQVEIWFSILVRRVIRRGSFTSKEDLRTKILNFIEYFNQVMAKPFKWTFTGSVLQV